MIVFLAMLCIARGLNINVQLMIINVSRLRARSASKKIQCVAYQLVCNKNIRKKKNV